jgi:hypothetical protein
MRNNPYLLCEKPFQEVQETWRDEAVRNGKMGTALIVNSGGAKARMQRKAAARIKQPAHAENLVRFEVFLHRFFFQPVRKTCADLLDCTFLHGRTPSTSLHQRK